MDLGSLQDCLRRSDTRSRRRSVTFAEGMDGGIEGNPPLALQAMPYGWSNHSQIDLQMPMGRSKQKQQSSTLASRAQLLMAQIRLPPRGYNREIQSTEPSTPIRSRMSEGGQAAFACASSHPKSERPRTQSSPGELSLLEDQPCAQILPKISADHSGYVSMGGRLSCPADEDLSSCICLDEAAIIGASSPPKTVRPRTQSPPGVVSLPEDSAQACAQLLPKISVHPPAPWPQEEPLSFLANEDYVPCNWPTKSFSLSYDDMSVPQPPSDKQAQPLEIKSHSSASANPEQSCQKGLYIPLSNTRPGHGAKGLRNGKQHQWEGTSGKQPATSNQQPATNNQWQATSGKQPATSNQWKATSGKQHQWEGMPEITEQHCYGLFAPPSNTKPGHEDESQPLASPFRHADETQIPELLTEPPNEQDKKRGARLTRVLSWKASQNSTSSHCSRHPSWSGQGKG